MASGIILSAGVRQNLLSLQATADLMSTTQSRLATGKKVNSALDNPSNFFTSQSLSNRASDLNSLLDSIGQAQSTLKAADQGLTSLTKLVQSAKSIAQQARATTGSSATYDAVDVTSTVGGAETLGAVQGADLSPKAIALSFSADAETAGTTTATASAQGVGLPQGLGPGPRRPAALPPNHPRHHPHLPPRRDRPPPRHDRREHHRQDRRRDHRWPHSQRIRDRRTGRRSSADPYRQDQR